MATNSREEPAGSFGKSGQPRGRPLEDRFQRRLEIFQAVAPLLVAGSARRLTMEQAARAACLSVGGLYHYFPTKRGLLLFPLQPEPCAEQMRRFEAAYGHLRDRNPDGYVQAYIGSLVELFPLVRAGMLAAVELGAREFWTAMEEGIDAELEERLSALAQAGVPAADHRFLARSLRRALMGALLDPTVTPEELHAQLLAIVARPAAPAADGGTGFPAAAS